MSEITVWQIIEIGWSFFKITSDNVRDPFDTVCNLQLIDLLLTRSRHAALYKCVLIDWRLMNGWIVIVRRAVSLWNRTGRVNGLCLRDNDHPYWHLVCRSAAGEQTASPCLYHRPSRRPLANYIVLSRQRHSDCATAVDICCKDYRRQATAYVINAR